MDLLKCHFEYSIGIEKCICGAVQFGEPSHWQFVDLVTLISVGASTFHCLLENHSITFLFALHGIHCHSYGERIFDVSSGKSNKTHSRPSALAFEWRVKRPPFWIEFRVKCQKKSRKNEKTMKRHWEAVMQLAVKLHRQCHCFWQVFHFRERIYGQSTWNLNVDWIDFGERCSIAVRIGNLLWLQKSTERVDFGGIIGHLRVLSQARPNKH